MSAFQLEPIQAALREAQLDGWLFFDHHERDPLAYRVLGFKPVGAVTVIFPVSPIPESV